MKIRQGFVSNSSSTSFCIFGACIDNIKDWVGPLDPDFGIYEAAEALLKDTTGLSYIADPDSGRVYIGREWSTVKDDETGAQFKASIRAAIEALANRVNKPVPECDTCSETIST